MKKVYYNDNTVGLVNLTSEGGIPYVAGTGIDITNDVISVTGMTAESAFTAYTAATATEIGNKADTTAMTQAISEATSGKVDTSTYTTYTAATDSVLAGKQTTLTAGTGISIVDNVISAEGGGSITIDPTLDSGSTNAVANSAITTAINEKVSISDNNFSGYSHEFSTRTPEERITPPSNVKTFYLTNETGAGVSLGCTISGIRHWIQNLNFENTPEDAFFDITLNTITSTYTFVLNNEYSSQSLEDLYFYAGGGCKLWFVDKAISSGQSANVLDVVVPDVYNLLDSKPNFSDVYTTGQTSGATEITIALTYKLDTTDFNTYSGNVDTVIGGKASQSDLETVSGNVNTLSGQVATKQDVLSAGTGIEISGNVISATGGGSITIDPTLDSGSTNAVANSAITTAINAKADKSTAGGGLGVSSRNNHEIVQLSNQNGTSITGYWNEIGFARINNRAIVNQGTSSYENFSLVETSAITTAITSSSTDSEVPSAKAVYDIVGNIETLLSQI